MTMHKNFVFYFPYRGVGGIPVLFLRMATLLKSNFNINCYVVDYEDGHMAKNLPEGVKLIKYTEEGFVEIPEKSCLIFQSDLPWGIPLNLKVPEKTTMYFWTCYPFNFIPVLPGKLKVWMSETPCNTKLMLNTLLYPAKLKVQKYIQLLIQHKALCFMDGTNLTTTENYLNVQIQSPIFIPIMINPITKKGPAPLGEELNMCWIGRLGDFKTFILRRTLEDLSQYASKNKKKISFTVIGSDPIFNKELLFKFKNDYFFINHIEHLTIDELNNFLITNVNLLFAMGTSALEGAKMAIPTILLNFSYKEVSNKYRYNFIQNSEQFNLGELITDNNISRGLTIEDVVKRVQAQYQLLSDQTLEYFLQHHSSDIWAGNFLELAEKSDLEYARFIETKLHKKPFYFLFWKFLKKLI